MGFPMTDRPILFSAPMVRAILEGRKTQTRRIAKPMKGGFVCTGKYVMKGQESDPFAAYESPTETRKPARRDIYGSPGDHLWVKETFFAWGRWEARFSPKKARDEWHFIDMTLECGEAYLYASDGVSDTRTFVKRRSDVAPMFWKRPAIFMPRHASRLLLEVTGIRVEQLQDIDENGAMAEGVVCARVGNLFTFAVPGTDIERLSGPAAFMRLWASINGMESWDANPWVWVVEFKRVEEIS